MCKKYPKYVKNKEGGIYLQISTLFIKLDNIVQKENKQINGTENSETYPYVS